MGIPKYSGVLGRCVKKGGAVLTQTNSGGKKTRTVSILVGKGFLKLVERKGGKELSTRKREKERGGGGRRGKEKFRDTDSTVKSERISKRFRWLGQHAEERKNAEHPCCLTTTEENQHLNKGEKRVCYIRRIVIEG